MVLVIGLAPYLLVLFLFGLLTRWLIKKTKSRIILNTLATLGMWLFLFGDTVPLRYEYYQLCKNEAGYEIYEYINQSIDDFTDSDGKIDWHAIEKIFRIEREGIAIKPKAIDLTIKNFYYNDELIGEIKIYYYRSGSFFKGFASSGKSCPGKYMNRDFYLEVFKG